MENIKSYRTRQREIILDYMKKCGGSHLTVDEIFEGLKKEDAFVGKTTIYRYLDALNRHGVVRKYTLDDASGARFEYVADEDEQSFHVKCLECGEMAHVKCGQMEELYRHLSGHHGFRAESAKTVIYGHCTECEKNRGGRA